jgi:poly(3-hydroxybutyrate) depolymerase
VRARLALGSLVAMAVLTGCGGGSGPRPTPPMLGDLAGSGAGHRFYEIYQPAGPVRGTMLMLHGGSWMDSRGEARTMLTVASLVFRNAGWRVVNVSYSPGNTPSGSGDPLSMLRDVVAFYDQIHRAFPGPICAYGESAGGHLAAMLAIERPSLRCAILNAAPLDLVTLRHQTTAVGAASIADTFGTNRATLASWSPARLWNPQRDATAIFATAASNDQTVPPAQLNALQAVDSAVNGQVIAGASPGSAALPYMHSDVDARGLTSRLTSLVGWLDGIVPPASGRAAAAGTDIGAACSAAGTERWRLLLSGDAWQQSSTAGQPIAATRGCSGSARWQDDGLSLWALPSPPAAARLPAGSNAALALVSNHPLSHLTVSFRGFLARPRDWVLGLYAASSAETLSTPTSVAECNRGACSGGLVLVPTAGGALLTSAGSHADPDASDVPPRARFALPPGTRALAWQLRCAAPGGCSLRPAVNAAGASLRPRDPLGQPAIFSIYKVGIT